jgi:hypothetical protein
MSNEILPGKLSADPSVSAGSPLVMEKKKENEKKSRGGLPLFLLAIGLGAVAIASITLLAPVAFYGHVESSPGSIDDTTRKTADGAAVITSALAASATATDGIGTVIGNNGLTKSGEMTIADYSDGGFSTELHCAIDSLPAYCSGSPITFSGLPPGEHVFTKVESINDQITVQYFGWNILG